MWIKEGELNTNDYRMNSVCFQFTTKSNFTLVESVKSIINKKQIISYSHKYFWKIQGFCKGNIEMAIVELEIISIFKIIQRKLINVYINIIICIELICRAARDLIYLI